MQARSVGGGGNVTPSLCDLCGFWYSLFLVLNGMTFEGKMRKSRDIFRMKLFGGRGPGRGAKKSFVPKIFPTLANLTLRPSDCMTGCFSYPRPPDPSSSMQ